MPCALFSHQKEVNELAKSVEQSAESKEKHCSDCETKLDYDAIYCWKCGKKI